MSEERVTISDGREFVLRPMNTKQFFAYAALPETDVGTVWPFLASLADPALTREEVEALPWTDTRKIVEASLRVNAMTNDEAETLGKD